jgi:hypothetical protein
LALSSCHSSQVENLLQNDSNQSNIDTGKWIHIQISEIELSSINKWKYTLPDNFQKSGKTILLGKN